MNPPVTPNQSAQTPQPQPAPPRGHWPLSRQLTILIAAIIGLTVIIIGIVLLVRSTTQPEQKATSNEPTYTENRLPETKTFQKDTTLVSEPDGRIITYNGVNVIQACSVLTLENLQEVGLRVAAYSSEGAVSRVYFDGHVSAQSGNTDAALYDEEGNYCEYRVDEKDYGFVKLNVYQPAYANKKTIDSYLSGDASNESKKLNGMTVYELQSASRPSQTTYILRSDKFDAKLEVKLTSVEAKAALVEILTKTLTKGANGTQGQVFSYQSSTAKNAVVDACGLLADSGQLKSIMGNKLSPQVDEQLATIAVDNQTKKSDTHYGSIIRTCSRRTIAGDSAAKRLTVRARTFESEEAAKSLIAIDRTNNEGSQVSENIREISPKIGDETLAKGTLFEDVLIVRKGRVIIYLHYSLGSSGRPDGGNKNIDTLRPLAELMVSKYLKDF